MANLVGAGLVPAQVEAWNRRAPIKGAYTHFCFVGSKTSHPHIPAIIVEKTLLGNAFPGAE
jgi:hypothetical protein